MCLLMAVIIEVEFERGSAEYEAATVGHVAPPEIRLASIKLYTLHW